MIHLFFISVILSEVIFDPLDKLPLVIFGAYGIVLALVRGGAGVKSTELLYLVFVIYLFVTAPYMMHREGVLVYCVYYLLQFGLLLYILSRLSACSDYLRSQLGGVVAWQSFFVVLGAVDAGLYLYGIESPLRDYDRSWKVDSFYKSPNIFGVVSALVVVYLMNWKHAPSVLIRRALIFLNLFGVIVSGSSMALGVVLVSEGLKRFGLRLSVVVSILGLAFAYEAVVSNAPEVLNRRIEIWTAAIEAWKTSPWLGIGSGNFQRIGEVVIGGADLTGSYALHSLYLWLLVETGVFGTFFFSLFIISFVIRLIQSPWRAYAYTLPLVLFLSQLTENYLDHEELFIAIFWLTIGAVLAKKGSPNVEK